MFFFCLHTTETKEFYFKQFSLAWEQFQCQNTVLFQTSQPSISTQFSSIWGIDMTLSGTTTHGPQWTWEWWQWRRTLYFQKHQHYWILSIRLFIAINQDTRWEGSYSSAEKHSVYSIYIYIYIFIKINRSTNEFQYGILGFIFSTLI